jgi:GNAT superfamily N-acetyltransferase
MKVITVRSAKPFEADFLTELALRSKAHWGYDSQFIEDCRADLTIKAEDITSLPFYVLCEDENIRGFYSLAQWDEDVELVHLFIEPTFIGKGAGKRLFHHAVETAQQLGYKKIMIQSDPFAENFYQAMGAVRIGKISSSIREGRELPLMEFNL